jgi:high-affinity iron transporter
MLAGFLLSLREGLEAALVIGIVFGALQKMKRAQLMPHVWRGVAAAAAVSAMVALGLNWLGMEFDGTGEQIFEGSAMLLAACILTWMIFWMRRQGGGLKNEIEARTGAALAQNGGRALFMLAFLAVVREGIELALFLLAARFTSTPLQALSGTALGLSGAALLGRSLVASTRRLNMKNFFQATNFLLVLFAAGLVGLGVREFNEAGLIPMVIEHVWDISAFLSDETGLGAVLKALFGYASAPSLTMVIAYLAYFVAIGLSLFRAPKPSVVVRAS